MKLERRSLEELSQLKYEFYTCDDVLVVAFEGEYGFASGGNDDARFMTAIIKAALSAFRPLALLIDLRRMKYEWGDAIGEALCASDDQYIDAPFPTAVLMSELNREGLTSLIESETEIPPAEFLFDSLEAAMEALERATR